MSPVLKKRHSKSCVPLFSKNRFPCYISISIPFFCNQKAAPLQKLLFPAFLLFKMAPSAIIRSAFFNAVTSSSVKHFKTSSFTSSMISVIGSCSCFPFSVGTTRTSRLSSRLMTRSIRPFFCIRSNTPEIVEVSRQRISEICFGVANSLCHRQLNTPYWEGVRSYSESLPLRN